MLTVFVLAGNTLLRPLVTAINRAPLKEQATEAIYEVRLTVAGGSVDEGRELLETLLGEASYPFREIEMTERDDDTVELAATLVATEADPEELDEVVGQLNGAPVTRRAGWSLRTAE
jgi:putative Mg2+ transporter-C (MgtC) family protein